MLKSDFDNRQFKYLTLANGLRVFLIQDNNCTKSAAAITINSGHFNDEKNCQGLSHLLEHSLFLGNHQQPAPNEFSSFLDAVGGSVNAQTGTEYTSYFADFPEEYQNQCVQQLSAMLLSPLFDETLITKEVHAIEAEFQLKKNDELRRLYQVHKETCNPEHPFSQFSVGNKEIFEAFSSSELKRKLKKLHHQYYQPQNACLCFVSNSDLSITEEQIQQSFGHWESQTKVPSKTLPKLYLPENLAIQINIKPVQSSQRLILSFALPNPMEHFRSKPLTILSHIIGDEGDGSLLNYFKQQGWASSLNAGGGIEGSNFKDFNINIQLTSVGVDKIDDIIQAIFSFIQMIKSEGIEKWRIKEVSIINQLMWDFSDATKSIDEALHFSQTMFEYPAEFLLAGDYILDQIKPELVTGLMDYFVPSNMRLKLVSPDIKITHLAKWYNTPYSIDKLPTENTQLFTQNNNQAKLTLSKPNQFLPKSQQAKISNKKYDVPHPIIAQSGLQIWYGQDNKFAQPKGDCFLSFDCPAVNQGIEMVAGKRLWIALLNEKLNQRYYQANLAGMHFHFYPHQGGFSLQTNGFSSNQLEFYTKLLTQIVEHEDFSQNFAQVKTRQILGLSNKLLNKPINSLFSRLAVLMQQHNYLPSDMADTMQTFSPEDIYQTKKQLLNQFHLQGLMYGDWTFSEAEDISEVIKSFRNTYSIGHKLKRGVADIRQNKTHMHEVTCQHSDSAVVIYFQSPDASIENTALSIIAEQVVAGPFFHQLRTEQQLGYLVGSGYIPYNQHPGLAFYIQSPQASVEHLINAIHQFIQLFIESLNEYSEIWQTIKNNVIKQLSEKDTNLNMKSQRLWMAINNQDYDFTHSDKMIETISNLQLSSLKTFFTHLLSRQDFGEIILYSGKLDNCEIKLQSTIINDPKKFKDTVSFI